MALRMTERDVSGVTVLDIEGRIVLGEEIEQNLCDLP